MSRDIDRESHLLELISESFRDVELDGGVSLHKTIVLDNWGDAPEELAAVCAADEKWDWRKLVDDPELANVFAITGLSFYDAAGLRFHLPAFLLLAVKAPASQLSDLHYHLTRPDKYTRERLAILSPAQRRCTWEVLCYLHEQSGYDDPKLEKAIRGYWKSEHESRL